MEESVMPKLTNMSRKWKQSMEAMQYTLTKRVQEIESWYADQSEMSKYVAVEQPPEETGHKSQCETDTTHISWGDSNGNSINSKHYSPRSTATLYN